MKKRILSLIFAVIFVCSSFISCNVTDTENEKFTVITTIFPQYDFARAIVGDKGEVTMLLAPKSESHTYEPSMSDIKKISQADLFIYTGGGIDTWAYDIISSLEGTKTESVAISQFVSEFIEAVDHDHSDHADCGHDDCTDGECGIEFIAYDEHIWTSPKNAICIFDGILEEICRLDPENDAYYRANAEVYRNGLTELDKELSEAVAGSVNKEIVVADRFPFIYLTEHYGIKYHAALSGCSVGSEPSAAVIAELISTVTDHKTDYVFVIENSTCNVAELISEATGCGILMLHSCHNVSEEELKAEETYISLMRKNIENLKIALN